MQLYKNRAKNLIKNEDKKQIKLDNKQQIFPLYRVQLSSFAVQVNADKFLKSLDNNQYDLLIKQINKYYIVYSVANSLSEAEQQQRYYKESYQVSAIVFQLDNKSKPAL